MGHTHSHTQTNTHTHTLAYTHTHTHTHTDRLLRRLDLKFVQSRKQKVNFVNSIARKSHRESIAVLRNTSFLCVSLASGVKTNTVRCLSDCQCMTICCCCVFGVCVVCFCLGGGGGGVGGGGGAWESGRGCSVSGLFEASTCGIPAHVFTNDLRFWYVADRSRVDLVEMTTLSSACAVSADRVCLVFIYLFIFCHHSC